MSRELVCACHVCGCGLVDPDECLNCGWSMKGAFYRWGIDFGFGRETAEGAIERALIHVDRERLLPDFRD